MDAILVALNNFANQHAWFGLVVIGILSLHTILKGVRDVIDKTPMTDDNIFEKAVTILGGLAKYIGGIRPKQNP